jgi:predicted nucleic acid-binding protein
MTHYLDTSAFAAWFDPQKCGYWDLCHIVVARKFELPFVTCDVRQNEAAKVIGIKTTLIR